MECGEDVLEVRINNHAPVIRPWHPYRLDISEYVTAGENSLELTITNTIMNMLEAERKESGLLTEPEIRHAHLYSVTV